MKSKDWAALMVSLATLLGAIGALYEKVRVVKQDKAVLWDNLGDQVAEVETLKERLARLEKTCKVPEILVKENPK